jgi:hypothetical protein
MTFAEFCLTHGDAGLLRPAPAGRARQWPKVIEREGHTWVYVHSTHWRGSWRGGRGEAETRRTSYPRRDAASQVPGFCDACEELLWAFRKTCAYVCRRMLGGAGCWGRSDYALYPSLPVIHSFPECGKRIHHRCYQYTRFTCALDMSLLSVCSAPSTIPHPLLTPPSPAARSQWQPGRHVAEPISARTCA